MKSLCVYCGSSSGTSPLYLETAIELGQLLAARDMTLVYGGGNVGLMGALADATLQAGGQVIGVMPRSLVDKEIAHSGLTELHTVGSMHERKALMAELSDAFLALPGGAGTLEEVIEVFVWTQLGLHSKPVGLLDVKGFYKPLHTFLCHMVEEKFLKTEHLDSLLLESQPEVMLDKLAELRPVYVDKWFDRKTSNSNS